MSKFIYAAIMAGFLAGCSTTPTQYYQGCFDGISSAKFMFSLPEMKEPEMADYFCKVVERKHDEPKEHSGK